MLILLNKQSIYLSIYLKERILTHLPGLQDYKQGQNVYLAFGDDLGATVHSVHESCDEEAIHLARAASILRKDIFSKKCQFDGSFEQECQLKSVPASLLSLVNMILYGPSIDMQSSAMSKVKPVSRLARLSSSIALYDDAVKTQSKSGEIKIEKRHYHYSSDFPFMPGRAAVIS